MPLKKPITFETAFATYEATEVIGQGGSGRVFDAVDNDGRRVAIKLLNATTASTRKRRRFKNEIAFCSKEVHPGIVAVLDVGLHSHSKGSHPFYVMPHYPTTLRTHIAEGVPAEKALAMFSAITDAVEAAHLCGVYHRDLKPENVLCNPDTGDLVVADFGIAHFHEDFISTAVETDVGERLANFMYAAPEQRTKGRAVDHRADIYALGLILNEMLTQEVPLGTEFRRIAQVHPHLAHLDELVDGMIRQSPEDRPQSLAAVKNRRSQLQGMAEAAQTLDQLTRKVVRVDEFLPPLAQTPPEVVDVNWDGKTLTIWLDQEPTEEWRHVFTNLEIYEGLPNREPRDWSFVGREAYVKAPSHEVQQLINHFKDWLEATTSEYARLLRLKAERERQHLEQRLEKAREVANERAELLKSLKW